ncbi:putative Histidine kinase [Nitrospina gracilis 3/211]|uniref:histidine kinase n=1 Tax=Nitrospina gracilis (strain 3/211) TaxID=1266370 RepID=M1YYB0_NITG3|nr:MULTISPECIES: hybrid sensor histidine kinase/response regulator [Nitrospina]MCF8723584.1 signal transduction histidine kinase/CheY-like chemotaxis protein [Nitrospina sp. Nb-3]CCQ90658.1 putative Histidine kinase [Nitrospina gracilis 3/211]
MNTSRKIFGLIALVGVLVGMLGYFLLNHSQSIIKERIAGEIQHLTESTLESVNRILFMRGEELQILAHSLPIMEMVEQSNREFDALPDRDAFIRQMDKDWLAGQDTRAVRTLLNNPLSRTFTEKRRFLQKKYGVEVFNEIFATNRYGALIAASPRTTDYYQADESWYREALKSEDDVYVEDIAFDESTNSFSTTVAVRLRDDENRFVGMIKAGLHIVVIRNLLDQFKKEEPIQSLNYFLVDGKGAVILSSLASAIEGGKSPARIHPFGKDLSSWEPVSRVLAGENGYYFQEEGGQTSLITYQRSRKFENVSGLRWSLILQMDAKEVLEPVSVLRVGLGSIWGVLIVLALVVGGVLIFGFVQPAEKLMRTTRPRVRPSRKRVLSDSVRESPVGETEPIQDISLSFKNMTDELVLHLEELEKQVSTKAEELFVAKKDAEKANQAKSLFISNMSHEIRTPLNAVLGYAQILDRDPKLDSKQKAKIKGIYHSGSRLLQLINDVLDISKIEAQKEELHIHPFNLNDLIWEVDSRYGALCRGKGLEWAITGDVDRPLPVFGDEQKTHRVLSNLLDNAFKFTESGRVELRVTQEEGDRYRFEVIDTGPGIAPENQEAVFGIFEQGKVGVEKGGVGLGLAICRRLVKLMGGDIKLESQNGGPTRFIFELPLPPAQRPQRVGPADLKKHVTLAPGTTLRTLIVDDDPNHLDIMQEILQRVGMEVKIAVNGREGLAVLEDWNPDLLLIDYRMPEMDGLEMLREISRRHGPDRYRIVMVSASALDHEKKMFLDNGVTTVVSKPLVREELLEVIRRIMSVEFVAAYQDNGNGLEAEKPIVEYTQLSVPTVVVEEMREALAKGLFDEFEKLLPTMAHLGPEEEKLAARLQCMAEACDKASIAAELDKIPPHH